MDLDDRPIGRLLSRREALAVLGAGGLSLFAGLPRGWAQGRAGSPGCVVRPAQTQGPYFVDERLDRSDLRSDPSDGTIRPGTPLALTIAVARLSGNSCSPLPGALVDVWHCDHLGIYSDVRDPGFDTKGKQFLRGYQLTDAQGEARFTTIYPGWYEGRTVHIHFKVRSPAGRHPAYVFTSQLYFDDALTDRVYEVAPYSGRKARSTRNAADGIYQRGGAQLILALTPQGVGYAGTFQVALTDV